MPGRHLCGTGLALSYVLAEVSEEIARVEAASAHCRPGLPAHRIAGAPARRDQRRGLTRCLRAPTGPQSRDLSG